MVVETTMYIYVRKCIASASVCNRKLPFKMLASSSGTNAVLCTDLSGKESHRRGRMVTSESLGGALISTVAQNARDVGSIPTLYTIFPIFFTGL